MGNFVEDKGRIGGWIETHTGTAFYPLDPIPEEIKIEDIAHALSYICRFNGHCDQFYSVAQHSLNVQRELRERGYSEEIQLFGLLHDASEAYICDIPRPIKPYIEGYFKTEEKLMNAIIERYGIKDMYWAEVKPIDDDMLCYEANKLMPCTVWRPMSPFMYSEPDISERHSNAVKNDFLSSFYDLYVGLLDL